ncbi:MAG: hypothetical protein ABI346_01490 [Candidatus Baltobacteraceae bacterium]
MSDVADRGFRRRMTLAFGLAIAFHEVLAGFVPSPAAKPEPTPRIIAERFSMVRRPRPTPKPTPRPTAVPTPRATPPPTPPARASHSPRVVRVAAAPKLAAPKRKRHGGAAAPHADRPIVVRRPKELALITPAPIRAASSRQAGKAAGVAGGGIGAGAGPGAGNGGEAGNGATDGRGGNAAGTGLGSPSSPCGHPLFFGLRNHYRDGKFYEDVRIIIPLRDGRIVQDDLHWPWIYASEAANPWSDQNIRDEPDAPAAMQTPPPGYDLAAQQKPETAIAIKYTGHDGWTTLPDCPGAGTPQV